MITSVARQLKLKFFAPLGKIFGFAEAWFHNAGNPFVKRAFLLDGGIVSGLGDETEYFVDDINMLVASNNVDFATADGIVLDVADFAQMTAASPANVKTGGLDISGDDLWSIGAMEQDN